MLKLTILLIILSYSWFNNINSFDNGTDYQKLQNNKTSGDTLIKAFFPGNIPEGQYLIRNISIPEAAFNLKKYNQEIIIGGNIEIEINREGKAKFLQMVNYEIAPNKSEVVRAVNQEFARTINQMPLWKPALRNGLPVISKQIIPILTSGFAQMNYEEYIEFQAKEKLKPNTKPVERKTKDGSIVYSFMATPPVYPGGDKALLSYLIENLRYAQTRPLNTKNKFKTLGIIINKEGEAEEIILLYPEDDAEFNYVEAQVVIKNMQKWQPAKQGKTIISSLYTLPIVLK